MLTDEEIASWKSAVNQVINEHKLKFIQLEVTRACNLKCVHCGSPTENTDVSNLLTKDEIKSTLEKIAEEIIDPTHFNHLMFVGGEPFSRKDLLSIVEDAYNVRGRQGARVYTNTQIQTNGIYIGEHPEVLDELKQKGVTGFGISIDGLGKTHNSFRGRNDAFGKTYKAVKEALTRSFSVSVSTVVNQSNVDELPELSRMIRGDLKPNYWRIMLLDPIGRARLNRNYLLSPDQIQKTIAFIYKEHVEHLENAYIKNKETKIELGCGGWCGKEIEGMIRPYLWHCIAGISMLGIMYDGAIGGCTNISRDFLEGNIKKDNITKVWNNKFQKYRHFDWKKTNECETCSEWNACDGGPMHYRLEDGGMVFCLYQTLHHEKDFRNRVNNDVLNTKAGN